jgi:hypothetical protein
MPSNISIYRKVTNQFIYALCRSISKSDTSLEKKHVTPDSPRYGLFYETVCLGH